jgi:hypothetical protein
MSRYDASDRDSATDLTLREVRLLLQLRQLQPEQRRALLKWIEDMRKPPVLEHQH